MQLQEAAREALAGDDLLHWRWKAYESSRDHRADALLELNVDGRRVVFEVEFKLSPYLVCEWSEVGHHSTVLPQNDFRKAAVLAFQMSVGEGN